MSSSSVTADGVLNGGSLSSQKFNYHDKNSLKSNLKLVIHVADFEDIAYSNGNVITHYIIQVKFVIPAYYYSSSSSSSLSLLNERYAKDSNSITKVAYKLTKRYTEFKLLYESLQDCIQLVAPDYRFPNKSLFSNTKEFTKMRRLKGFHDLLNILSDIRPFPRPLEDFIDLNIILNSGSTERVRTIEYLNSSDEVLYSSVNPRGDKDFDDRASCLYAASPHRDNEAFAIADNRNQANDLTHDSANSRLASHNDHTITVINDGNTRNYVDTNTGGGATIPTIPVYNTAATTDLQAHRNFMGFDLMGLEELLSEEIPPLLPASIKVALILYCSTILLKVVDTGQSSTAEVCATFLVLCLLVTLVRLHLKKTYSHQH